MTLELLEPRPDRDRGRPQPAGPARHPARHRRLRRPPDRAHARRPQALPLGALVGAHPDLRLRPRHGMAPGDPYPQVGPARGAARRLDARTADQPGSDLDFMREHYLDAYDVDYAHPEPALPDRRRRTRTSSSAPPCRTPSTSGSWTPGREPEPRLKASIAGAATRTPQPRVAEIERCAGNPHFAQVLLLAAHQRAARPAALLADLRGGRSAHGLPVAHPRRRLQRPSRRPAPAGRPTISRSTTGHVDGLPGARDQPRLRGRVRALPGAEGRADRGRLRLAAAAGLAARQALGAAARRGAAPEAAAVRVRPRAHLAHDPADGGAGRPAAPRRVMRMDRLGPADVRDRLPALGLRRPDPGAALRSRCPACAQADLPRQRARRCTGWPDGQARRRPRSTRSRRASASSSRCAAGRSASSTSTASSSRSANRCPHQGGPLCQRQDHRARRVGRARASTG